MSEKAKYVQANSLTISPYGQELLADLVPGPDRTAWWSRRNCAGAVVGPLPDLLRGPCTSL